MGKIIGIVAEYNPLHYGHLHQLQLAKNTFGADTVVVAMSGNFTQRGIPAILDKKARAELAIKAGADLILEIPAYYASGMLEDFALGSVSILDKLGFVEEILFGSECGEVDVVTGIAEAMHRDEETFRCIRQCMRTGVIPCDINRTMLPNFASSEKQYQLMIEAITKPNNMLGIFYMLALQRLRSRIKPITNKRIGQGFNDDSQTEEDGSKVYASATSIRKYLLSESRLEGTRSAEQQKWYNRACPCFTRQAIEDLSKTHNLINQTAMYELFKERIFVSGLDGLNKTLDITEDDCCRIKSAFLPDASYEQFISKAAAGLRSSARIDRCITHYVLNHKMEELNWFKDDEVTYYSTILACSEKGKALACSLRENSNLSMFGKLQHENDLYADSIYQKLMDGLRINKGVN